MTVPWLPTRSNTAPISAQFGSMNVLTMLVENGADVNSLDNMHHTPVIVSSYYAKSDISAFLVEKVMVKKQAAENLHGKIYTNMCHGKEITPENVQLFNHGFHD